MPAETPDPTPQKDSDRPRRPWTVVLGMAVVLLCLLLTNQSIWIVLQDAIQLRETRTRAAWVLPSEGQFGLRRDTTEAGDSILWTDIPDFYVDVLTRRPVTVMVNGYPQGTVPGFARQVPVDLGRGPNSITVVDSENAAFGGFMDAGQDLVVEYRPEELLPVILLGAESHRERRTTLVGFADPSKPLLWRASDSQEISETTVDVTGMFRLYWGHSGAGSSVRLASSREGLIRDPAIVTVTEDGIAFDESTGIHRGVVVDLVDSTAVLSLDLPTQTALAETLLSPGSTAFGPPSLLRLLGAAVSRIDDGRFATLPVREFDQTPDRTSLSVEVDLRLYALRLSPYWSELPRLEGVEDTVVVAGEHEHVRGSFVSSRPPDREHESGNARVWVLDDRLTLDFSPNVAATGRTEARPSFEELMDDPQNPVDFLIRLENLIPDAIYQPLNAVLNAIPFIWLLVLLRLYGAGARIPYERTLVAVTATFLAFHVAVLLRPLLQVLIGLPIDAVQALGVRERGAIAISLERFKLLYPFLIIGAIVLFRPLYRAFEEPRGVAHGARRAVSVGGRLLFWPLALLLTTGTVGLVLQLDDYDPYTRPFAAEATGVFDPVEPQEPLPETPAPESPFLRATTARAVGILTGWTVRLDESEPFSTVMESSTAPADVYFPAATAALIVGLLMSWIYVHWIVRVGLRRPIRLRWSVGVAWAMLLVPTVPLLLGASSDMLRQATVDNLGVYPFFLPLGSQDLAWLLIVTAIGGALLWGMLDLSLRLADRPAATTWFASNGTRWWFLLLVGIAALPLGRMIPEAGQSLSIDIDDLQGLVYAIDRLLPYALVIGLVTYLGRLNPKSGYELIPPAAAVGTLIFGYYLAGRTANLLFVPIPLIVGALLFGKVVLRKHASGAAALTSEQLRDRVHSLVAYQRTRRLGSGLRKTLEKKVTENQISPAVMSRRLDQHQADLVAARDALPGSVSEAKESLFGVGAGATPWENGKTAVLHGFVFSIPFQASTLASIFGGQLNYHYAFLTVLDVLLYSMTSWILIAFLFGYFFHSIRGRHGLEKALVFAGALALATIPLRIVQADPLLESGHLLEIFQIITYLTLLALVAFDLRVLQKLGFGRQELLSVHGLTTAAAYGSTLVLGAAASVASTQLSDLFKYLFGPFLGIG